MKMDMWKEQTEIDMWKMTDGNKYAEMDIIM